VRFTVQAWEARKRGAWPHARLRRPPAPRLPSRAPHDPTFRRLWSGRDADDWLLGRRGAQGEAAASQQELRACLPHDLHMERNEANTWVTHAHDAWARLLGYEVPGRHEHSTHDFRRRRGSTGSLGRRGPTHVLDAKRTRPMRRGKPKPLPQRTLDEA
jgi:hypothetical protein